MTIRKTNLGQLKSIAFADKNHSGKNCPDGAEGSADNKDVSEAQENAVYEIEVLISTVKEILSPDRYSRVLCYWSTLSQDDNVSDGIEQKDEQNYEDGEPSKELHVEDDGADLEQEAGKDQRKPGEVVTEQFKERAGLLPPGGGVLFGRV